MTHEPPRDGVLREKIRTGSATYVFLDPDGSIDSSSIFVIVEKNTDVIYGTQCAGVGCAERLAEGYLVPVGGVRPSELRAVFHNGNSCHWDLIGRQIPADRLDTLRTLVASIPFWITGLDRSADDRRLFLSFDDDRLDETAEAWVPVHTPVGPGFLTWDNCD